jgi:hypothetical protein
MLVACVVALSFAGVAHADDAIRVAVMVTGDEDPAEAARRALESPAIAVDVALVELPASPPAAEHAARALESIAEARGRYVEADFDACLRAVEDDARLTALLATSEREVAARLSFWRVACRVGVGDADGARREALRFAVFGLPLPEDAGSATPDVESALSAALREVESAPRVSLRVDSTPRGAISVDGREPSCTAPCEIDLPEGDHVIAVEAPGFVRAARVVRASAGAEVSIALDEAPPEVAAAQWRARHASFEAMDSTESVVLLSRATRARRLVVFSVLSEGELARIRGALAIDGRVAARAERGPSDGTVEEISIEVLRELLVRGEVIQPAPDIWESPWFWIAIGVVAAGTAALTTWLLYDPGTRTTVGF